MPGAFSSLTLNNEITRYIVSGVAAFAADFCVFYSATTFLHIHYLVANLMGLFTGLCVAYSFNVRWVFNTRRFRERVDLEMVIFVAIVLVGVGINELGMYLLVGVFGASLVVAKILVTLVVTVFNYTSKKLILFSGARNASSQ